MKVLVQSFSYKRTGYPTDTTGKGGGFVFDCRAIDAYDYDTDESPNAPFPHMNLTGLDPKIINTLNADVATQIFFESGWTMVKLDIDKCLKRGFGVMTVNFGCTAGQHRSVYMANKMAERIKLFFNAIDVELIHIERPYWPPQE